MKYAIHRKCGTTNVSTQQQSSTYQNSELSQAAGLDVSEGKVFDMVRCFSGIGIFDLAVCHQIYRYCIMHKLVPGSSFLK